MTQHTSHCSLGGGACLDFPSQFHLEIPHEPNPVYSLLLYSPELRMTSKFLEGWTQTNKQANKNKEECVAETLAGKTSNIDYLALLRERVPISAGDTAYLSSICSTTVVECTWVVLGAPSLADRHGVSVTFWE